MSDAKSEADKILESLSHEERLKLLEKLIQGATEAHEETLTVEDRLERLENLVLGGMTHQIHRGVRRARAVVRRCVCCL